MTAGRFVPKFTRAGHSTANQFQILLDRLAPEHVCPFLLLRQPSVLLPLSALVLLPWQPRLKDENSCLLAVAATTQGQAFLCVGCRGLHPQQGAMWREWPTTAGRLAPILSKLMPKFTRRSHPTNSSSSISGINSQHCVVAVAILYRHVASLRCDALLT